MTLAQFNHEKDQRIAIHHILLRSAWLADDVMRELSLGASFEELAEEYSACLSATNQGFTGLHLLDHLPETLRIALLTDNGRNPYVGPVKTPFGFHILKSCQIIDPSHENSLETRLETTDENPPTDHPFSAIEEALETLPTQTDEQMMEIEDTGLQNREDKTSEPKGLGRNNGDNSPSS